MVVKSKTCRDCLKLKPQHEFIKNKQSKNGYDTLCILCNRQRVKAHRKKTKRRHGRASKPQSSAIYREIIIDLLIKRDGFFCGLCHQSLENSKLHLDHINPQAFGGTHTLDNIQLAHAACNTQAAYAIRKTALGW